MDRNHPDYDPKHQTFCIYCQDEHHTFDKLKDHLREEHGNTIAQNILAPTWENIMDGNASDDMHDTFNREQRRRIRKQVTCLECRTYLDDHTHELVNACGNIAIEAGVLPQEAIVMFFEGFHAADHNTRPTISPEVRDAGPSPTAN